MENLEFLSNYSDKDKERDKIASSNICTKSQCHFHQYRALKIFKKYEQYDFDTFNSSDAISNLFYLIFPSISKLVVSTKLKLV